MSGFLLGVPGRLKTLLDRLTSDRAANLDEITSTRMARMDTTISSRAPSGDTTTLLARLTAARGNNLDEITSTRLARLDQTVGSRATPATVWSNGTRTLTATQSPIKSIQRGSATTGAATAGDAGLWEMRYLDVTISAVNTSKSIAMISGSGGSSASGIIAGGTDAYAVGWRFVNSTTLRIGIRAVQDRIGAQWTVVEYN